MDMRDRQKEFGQYLQQLRERASDPTLTQKEAAQIIFANDDGGNNVRAKATAERAREAKLARIETGSTGVNLEYLEKIAEAYGEPLDRLASSYVTTMIYGQSVPRFLLESTLRGFRETTLDSTFSASNRSDFWTLHDIADWEKSLRIRFPPRELQLWIISSDFLDFKNRAFQDIIIDLIMHGTDIRYFVPQTDTQPSGHFDRFIYAVIARLKTEVSKGGPSDTVNWGKISVWGLLPSELAWFTSSLVVAFQGSGSSITGIEGFSVISVEDAHTFAIPLSSAEISEIEHEILDEIARHEADLGNNLHADNHPRTWKEDAMRQSEAFKREFGNE